VVAAPSSYSRTRAAADRMRAEQEAATAERQKLDSAPTVQEDQPSSIMERVCADLHIPLNRGWLYLLREHKAEFGDLSALPKFTALQGEEAKRAEDILRRGFEDQ
jgi:hypothetical protein